MIRVTVWNEYRHEKTSEKCKEIYPNGIHGTIKEFLSTNEDMTIRTATLDEPENGLTDEVLEATDVLIWWGHIAHNEVLDSVVEKVHKRILEGMGLIVLHSGHKSKIFMKALGTTANLTWRENNEKCRVWNIAPFHPIAQGVGNCIELEQEETYAERFDIPDPDELVFISWFSGGEVFRSGCCFHRGAGKIFYFQPGHETFPTFHNNQVQKVITNAVRWAYVPKYTACNQCIHEVEAPEK